MQNQIRKKEKTNIKKCFWCSKKIGYRKKYCKDCQKSKQSSYQNIFYIQTGYCHFCFKKLNKSKSTYHKECQREFKNLKRKWITEHIVLFETLEEIRKELFK